MVKCKMNCLPQSWNNAVKKRDRQEKLDNSKTKRRKREDCNKISEIADIFVRYITEAISEGSGPSEIRLPDQLIMDSMPFSNVLIRLEKGVGHDIPIVTRNHEEQYLREAQNRNEESCTMGSNCECMLIDPKNPFVGVRFDIPNLARENRQENKLCLLCLRKNTLLLYHHVVRRGNNISGPIQKFGNICGEPGEYHVSAMLSYPPGGDASIMPLPIVAHQRNRYEVVKRNGLHYLSQKHVNFEDFP